jgi:hypothetical protein
MRESNLAVAGPEVFSAKLFFNRTYFPGDFRNE